ncbi:EAL domain-containing protein [Flocculibacter collagenilyticus]|uniref:EAL domain-containing protein n=1 Tax=Flocculibacter collagenilyticus TaxID=2744479 RepID=UPI0018F61E26|nr:EAL domain-containing protein [Flocculibacter collagenilyticus]
MRNTITHVLLFIIMLVIHSTGYSSTLIVDDSFTKLENLSPYISSFKTSEEIDELNVSSEQLSTLESNPLRFTIEDADYWLIFDVMNRGINTKTLVLHFDNPMIDKLLVYDSAKQDLPPYLLGDSISNLTTKMYAFPYYQFSLAPNEQRSFLINVVTAGAPSPAVSLLTTEAFQNKQHDVYLLWGIFLGVCLVMMLYNFVLYFSIKDIAYLYYVGYVFFVILVASIIDGFGFIFFPEELQITLNALIIPLQTFVALTAMLFAMAFLRISENETFLYKTGQIFIWILGIFLFASILLREDIAANIFMPLQLFLYFYCFAASYIRIREGYNWAIFYLISWIPFFIGAALSPALLVGLLDYSFAVRQSFIIGAMLEISLISFALAYRFRANEQEKDYMAFHDEVTGLPNLKLLQKSIHSLIEDQRSFTLILFEPEKINTIRITLGMESTKLLMLEFTEHLTKYLENTVNMYQFEEKPVAQHICKTDDATFGLILTETYDDSTADFMTLIIKEAFATKSRVGNIEMTMNVNIGASRYPHHSDSFEDVYQKAFQALHHAKEYDIPFIMYNDSEHTNYQMQVEMLSDLMAAIKDNTLELYHQPVISYEDYSVVGSEVLLRWHHKTQGYINPIEIVQLTEDTGVISALTNWIINQAIVQFDALRAQGFNQTMFINISAKDLASDGFVQNIVDKLSKNEIDPGKIVLELTESIMLDDYENILSVVNKLERYNVRVAIDDYGTGHASLQNLTIIPFYSFKIARTFISKIEQSERKQVIVKNTISMAQQLGSSAVALGVETKATEAVLKEYGCKFGQGYLYCKPVALNKYIEWLQHYSSHL